ncbi:pyridoxamine 5'-phosphate oxidase family protein [Streptomyces antarcticus]|uniref:pyridoxamine 5'-phosphate oxidase family protein n=1 Tax=Streptomyces antarcticus TaxID=2996458 RepID=UPI00226EFB50|nr:MULTISPECIES: pyridoxamine 5'-phosphate oxidase family protein [unclassified Streptomyces]MCY0939860.1 pyridoxamine 5'-phosphate oxidase family protein [Streptomyces sp. H34-AA3]MCY0949955.1 pyridoxamine 5'-phosphate oxidase family protein [Streptomyces sp. H27-S2]MCZ4081030.1 pyridoxamine 5'-phosphate oxidase family protein [Streptomyces sp. H34-S5]
MATGYHPGELLVQHRADLAGEATFSLGAIGESVPAVAADFLAEQPMIILGGTDRAGRVWATQLTGDPGFLRSPDPRTLIIDALPLPEDPLADLLGPADAPAGTADAERPVRLGMIAIEPATRRRMRLNGRAFPGVGGLHVALDQVIANCPKYLQKRDFRILRADDAQARAAARTVTSGTALSAAQQRTVREADTFFVATASDSGDADASHRGGNPGFVQVLSPTRLRWPDYIGNAMFLTLGNLALNPAAGILFPNWTTGSVLHLSGTAHTVWDEEERSRVPGAQRLVEFSVTDVREISAASPLRWSEPGYSRFNPPVS